MAQVREKTIAEKNERITFQKNEVEVDEYRNHTSSWNEYFTAWVHFGLESNKEERSNAISLLQSLGKEAYRFSKFTFDGLYLELYW